MRWPPLRRAVVPRRGADDGSLTAEVVVLAPVVLLFALLIAGLGRVETVRAQVSGAARAAAEAASEAPDASAAAAAADGSAPAAVAGAGASCTDLSVSTDTGRFAPGGSVTVTVQCRVPLADLLVPGLPGSVTATSRVIAPIDTYRAP